MNRKYIIPVALLTSMTILHSPAYSQLEMPTVTTNQTFGFQPNPNPSFSPNVVGRVATPNQPGAQGVNNLMREWELEPDPAKKKLIAMEIQESLGVKADGIIGNQTMKAIQQAGGMGQPAPGGGFNPNPGGGGGDPGGGPGPGGGDPGPGPGGGDPGPPPEG